MSFNVKFCIKLHQFHVFQIFLHWLLRVRTFSWILKSTDRLICLKIRRLYTLSFIINTLCILR
jgi:UDP-2,3-diacylglucosamine pyrophosphatase LpxH